MPTEWPTAVAVVALYGHRNWDYTGCGGWVCLPELPLIVRCLRTLPGVPVIVLARGALTARPVVGMVSLLSTVLVDVAYLPVLTPWASFRDDRSRQGSQPQTYAYRDADK